jgi:hypothetical protein
MGAIKETNANINKFKFGKTPSEPTVSNQPQIPLIPPPPTPTPTSSIPPTPTPTPSITPTYTPTITPTPTYTPSSTPIPLTYILDDYSGATFAYSLRQLRSAYSGSAIRVRRSSDNTEQDIGFVNGSLDGNSLLSFIGAGDGFVTTWYDQSLGGGLDVIQTTSTYQPKIVSSGVLITDNGKPAIIWDGIDDRLECATSYNISSQSSFVICNMYSGSPIYCRIISQSEFGNDNDAPYIPILRNALTENLCSFADNNVRSSVAVSYNTQMIFSSIHTGTEIDNRNNGSGLATYSNSLSNTFEYLSLGNSTSTTGGEDCLLGTIQEVIIYNNIDQSGNEPNITTDINSFYSTF